MERPPQGRAACCVPLGSGGPAGGPGAAQTGERGATSGGAPAVVAASQSATQPDAVHTGGLTGVGHGSYVCVPF